MDWEKRHRGRIRWATAPPRPIGCFPRTPLRGTRTCKSAENFRRAKSEWLSAVQSGPLGPGIPKIETNAVPVLRLALPSRWRLVLGRRARPPGRAAFGWLKKCRRGDTPGRPAPMGSAGGPRASPTQFRKTFLKPVGEGLAPPDVPRYGGPVWDRPLQKDRNASTFSVGAGVLTRPLLRGSPFVGCGLPDAPSLRKSRNGTGYAVRLSRA